MAGYKSPSCYGETWLFLVPSMNFQALDCSGKCVHNQLCILEFEEDSVPIAITIILGLNPRTI